jgi:hypothetical protein
MSFPDTIFGICQVCGADGRDQTVGLTSADAAARDLTGNGIELKKYLGRFLCPICIQDAKADAESLLSAKKHAEAERFRGKAGFLNSAI